MTKRLLTGRQTLNNQTECPGGSNCFALRKRTMFISRNDGRGSTSFASACQQSRLAKLTKLHCIPSTELYFRKVEALLFWSLCPTGDSTFPRSGRKGVAQRTRRLLSIDCETGRNRFLRFNSKHIVPLFLDRIESSLTTLSAFPFDPSVTRRLRRTRVSNRIDLRQSRSTIVPVSSRA